MRYFSLLTFGLFLALGGCGMTDWANAHMPVIGERCENWQCFTESGREQSKLYQAEHTHTDTPAASSGPMRLPANADQTGTPGSSVPYPAMPASSVSAPVPVTAPAEPLAPPAPEGAYKYVPRAPLPPGASPFDGQISAPIQ